MRTKFLNTWNRDLAKINYKYLFSLFSFLLSWSISEAQLVNAKLVVNGNNLSVYLIPTSTEMAFVSAGSISLKGYPTGTGTIGTNTFGLDYIPGSFSSGDTSFYSEATINQNVNFVSGTPILIFTFTAPGPGPYSIVNALDYYYIEVSGSDRTGTASTCIIPAAPTGTLSITNSTCSNCAVSGGSIALGTLSGPGGTLQYSTDGGSTWSSTLPTYNQTGPAQTILARVFADDLCISTSVQVGITSPGTCPPAPSAPTGTLAIVNSTCTNCMVSGGSISIGTVSGSGGTLQFSTDGGTSWSATLPTYNQTGPAQIIIARVLAASGCSSGSTSVGTTIPGVCTTPSAPTGSLNIVNSTCDVTCVVSGGSISIGTVSGSGGTIQYSTDAGSTWSASIPTYNQTGPAQTIIASVLAANGCRSTTTSVGTTVPGTCPTAPSSPTGSLTIVNSTCSNCMLSGGSISLGSVSGTGGTLEYSTDNGVTWSASLPTYNQSGPAQTILARVIDMSGCASGSINVGITAPGVCVVPSAPTGTLTIINSICSSCLVSGGSIALGTVAGAGGTLEFSTNGGSSWSSTLPTYNQTGPAQTVLASILGTNGCRSTSTNVGTTIPGTCPTAPAAPTGTLAIVNSTCTSCMVGGGSISIGSVSGTGGTLQYSTDAGTTWSATLPTYNQTGPAQTIIARVLPISGCESNSTNVGTTSPGVCTTPSAPTGSLNIINSICGGNCVVSGGSITIGTVTGSGGTLQYSTDGGSTWFSSIPTYNQTGPAQTIIASILSANGCRSTTTDVGLTVPGSCPTAPADPTGTLEIVNSTCANCTLSGGSISIGSVSGTGGTLQFSTDNGTTWSTTLPTYNQSGPAQTILARIIDANGCASGSVTVGTTVPGTCIVPSAPTGSLAIINSTCTACTVGGGSIAIGSIIGVGGTLEYSTNGGSSWSASLPTYNQTGPAQAILASVLASNGCRSTSIAAGTTVPGVCTPVNIQISGDPLYCINENITLIATGASTYSWTGPNTYSNNTATVQFDSAFFILEGTYEVTGTGANGCTGQASFILDVDSCLMVNMTCVGQVNISLGANCDHCLSVYDVLKGANVVSPQFFTIEIFNSAGQLVVSNFNGGTACLGREWLGYNLIYKVTSRPPYGVNSCWGTLKLEDKQPPQLNCSVDTITCYELPNLPLLAEGEDSCSGVDVRIVSDQWVDYGCDQDTVLSGYVVRTIQGSDDWGNFARCTDTIFIRKTSLDSLECPELIELPCEITHQLYGSNLELKTAITVDQSKVTPEFLLSLQKATWELKNGGKGAILDPDIIVVPQIEGKNIYPDAGGSCKITAIYKDTHLDVCGAGFKIFRKWIMTDWCTLEEEICEQYIKVIDTSAPKVLSTLSTIFANTSPHDCVAGVVIPALVPGKDFKDCGAVTQKYTISYDDPSHPGKALVLTGDLPSKTLYLPMGEFTVEIDLVDACFNRTDTSRTIVITDITPPIPVCNEITQVTIDPATCWAKISAKDLDNGSRDNCCDVLHFAVAHMDSVTYWRNYWRDSLEARCGSYKYAKDKEFYEFQIERWINAYVFKDEIKFDDCGPNQVVLRVYEACGVPRYDPHVWPCTEHQWFWYNTDQRYRIEHNWNFFHKDGKKDFNYRYDIQCIDDHQKRGKAICEFGMNPYPKLGGLCYAQYIGAVESLNAFCESDFYTGPQAASTESNAPGSYCSERLYSDCMVQVLVDDKQAPEVHHLDDITVYCDNAPYYAGHPKECSTGKNKGIWPGYLKESDGTIHGYYGGSNYYDNDEHSLDCGHYDHENNWAPIYCREWLYIDSFDTSGQIDPKSYFDTYVLFDKNRPSRSLKENEFSITDNCTLNDATLTWTDEGGINGCGEGWIQRTWTIRDKCDNVVVAKQKVLVKHRSDFEVVFPEDKVVECDFLNSTEPEDTGEPEVTDDECEQIGVKYKDEIFTIEEDACYKIVRTWTLIDWCIYDPARQERYPEVIVDDRLRADTGNRECVYRNLKDNNDGYMQYIQIIKVVDKVAPIVNTRDTIVCIYGEDCTTSTVIPLSATDNCTEPSKIRFRVQIDINASEAAYNGRLYDANSIDQGGTRYETEFVFLLGTPGKHLVHVIGTDNCGNADTSTFRFELRDCKRPTPYCYRGIATVIMPSMGTVTVWAKDLDAGSDDNCTDKDDLVFSFSSDATQTSRQFSCADLPDGRSRTIPVEIWVTDEAGNQDHCSTYILLQDNVGNVCPDVAGLNVQIAGSVQTEGKEPVEFVTMNINGGGLQLNYETRVKGAYHFEALPTKSDYTIRAKRKDQPMNGVSTLDLILIQKHILGTEPLDSPYKIIAADADNDKQVTAVDLVELRKLILSTYEELPNAESWKFVAKAQQFIDPRNPWDFKTWMEMKQVEKDYMQEDWIGIKTGDVNSSAAPHSLMGTEVRGSATGLIFEVVDRQFNAGELVTVEFRSPNFRAISGFQGTISVKRDLLSVVSGQRSATNPQSKILNPNSLKGALNLTGQNFGTRLIDQGLLTMSWNSNTGIDVTEKEILFTMTFKAQQNGKLSEALRIGSQLTVAESYEGLGPIGRDPDRSSASVGRKEQPGNLSIRFVTTQGSEVITKSELYQNYPNPFDQRTLIGLRLAREGRGTLSIYDVTGRTISSIERDWTKGYHEVWFDRKEIGATGVLYYRFESGFFTDSRKMVILE